MKYLLLFSLTIMSNYIIAQDLSKHRWENRLILLLETSPAQPETSQQVSLLMSAFEELKERKLVIYLCSPEETKMLFPEEKIVSKDRKSIYSKFKSSEKGFEFCLIGLDGGVKLRKDVPISKEELFAVIDGMPMRRAELKRKNK